ncbi:peptidase M50, partial [Mycobacterium sp. ITM-2017-0098]
RAGVVSGRGRPRRWVSGRAAQLGTTGAIVVRDGEQLPRPVRRSTFYRHTEGWLRVGRR